MIYSCSGCVTPMALLTSQRAMIHHILEVNDFDPEDFDIMPSISKGAARFHGDEVRMKNTEYYFGIYAQEREYSSDEQFFVEYSPGGEAIREYDLCRNWNIVSSTFA